VAKARLAEAPEEWEAKWVVSEVLSGVPTRRDPPGHDYDIKVGSRSIALEVTKSAPAERNALNAAIHRLHQREQDLTSRRWQVAIPDARPGFRGPSLQAIFDNAPALLHALESYGVEAFGAGHENEHPPFDAQEPIRKLLELGLLWGQSVPLFLPTDRPQFLVGTRSRDGFLDPNDVNTCVEICAARKAGQLLAATEADERHLFVVVESTDYGAFAALTVGLSLPGNPPNLPQGINTVWVAAWRPGSWG
jgi:hypothetical protein